MEAWQTGKSELPGSGAQVWPGVQGLVLHHLGQVLLAPAVSGSGQVGLSPKSPGTSCTQGAALPLFPAHLAR
jgi:hypothetical protein